MTLLVVQLVSMVFWILVPGTIAGGPEYFQIALQYFNVIIEMLNVIIRSVHFYFSCFTENFTWLGNHTNNNFGAGVNEIVLR